MSDVFSDEEKQVITFADEMIRNVKVSTDTFLKVKAFLSPCEIQELIIAIGYYSMVGRFLETLEVDLEVGEDIQVVQISKVRQSVKPHD